MDIIKQLELEYHGICAANPEFEMTLWDFLVSREVEPDDIWEYSPEIGWNADQPEPEANQSCKDGNGIEPSIGGPP